MSDDKIAEIRARHSRDERWRNGPSMICPQAHDDRATLLAEVNRQRAENERLRENVDRLGKEVERADRLRAEIARVKSDDRKSCAEIKRLRADNERLLQAVGLATTAVPDMQVDIENPVGMMQRVVAEVDRQRAEIERLFNEDTKTRHALKGWVFVCPDGGDEPTHERVAAVVAEVEKLREEVERLRVAATSAGAALAAAIELLERGREDAPSKRMFSQMLADYRVIVARTRKALEGKP